MRVAAVAAELAAVVEAVGFEYLLACMPAFENVEIEVAAKAAVVEMKV